MTAGSRTARADSALALAGVNARSPTLLFYVFGAPWGEKTQGKMWLKLFFLLLYFLVLFVLARFFEAIVWYETGIFATQLVDPVALSFKKLKTILECRGLGYSGLPEKKDVRELVEKSGEYPAPLRSPPGVGGDLYFLVPGGTHDEAFPGRVKPTPPRAAQFFFIQVFYKKKSKLRKKK